MRSETLAARAEAALASRRLPWVALALVTLLALPALRSGYFLDDYMHRARLELGPHSLRAAANLYCLSSCEGGSIEAMAHGPLPWFNDPSARVDLLRPLSGLLFAADVSLFRDAPWLAHLHSLAWFVALLLAVRLLYREIVDRTVAGLALLLFALDDAHWQPLGWLSNRHGVVATVPVLFGLVAHIRWRTQAWRAGLPLSLLGYAVGVTGGESAMQAAAYVVAWELVATDRWSVRLRALLPAASVFGTYLLVYRGLGYGARGHEQYIDPAGEPLRFLSALAVRVPTLLADLLAGFPADLWAAMPSLHRAYVLVGLVAVLAVALMLRAVWPSLSDDARRTTRWLSLGAIGSLVPGAGALPGSRLLLMPSVGAAAVVALVLVHALRDRPPARSIRVGAASLAVVHLVVAPVALVLTFGRMASLARETERIARTAELQDALARDPSRIDVVVLNVPDLVTMLYPPNIRRLDPATRERSWWPLSVAPVDLRMTRTGLATFRLDAVGGAFFESEWERLFRPARHAFTPGARVDLPGLTIRVTSPTSLDVDATRPLDDPSLRLLSFRDGSLRRVEPPPVGATIDLPASRGLLEL